MSFLKIFIHEHATVFDYLFTTEKWTFCLPPPVLGVVTEPYTEIISVYLPVHLLVHPP